MSVRRWLAALLLGLVAFVAMGPGRGGASPGQIITLPGETTTAEEPTTVTTVAPTTTTTRPATTTTRATPTTARPAPTTAAPADEETTIAEEVSTTLEPTTSSIPLLVDGPPVDPSTGVAVTTTTTTTIPVAASTDEGKTSRQVALAVGGLLVLAAVFAILTVWYWRRTKPRLTAPAGTRLEGSTGG
jgi:cobalamin biosynthesis Mg chelatase CobN